MLKSDLHRHLGGSISPNLVHELFIRQGMGDIDLEEIQKSMQFQPSESFGFLAFLRKFNILNEIRWDEHAICRSVEQVYWDILKEKIDYAEVHFTIGKYVQSGWDPKDVILLLRKEFNKYMAKWGNKINLVFCLKYESPRSEQEQFASIIEDKDAADCVVGLNLVGDERYFDASFYEPIFDRWKEAGKGLIAHVGESQTVENIRSSIEILKVDRIAHGIKIVEDESIIELAKENDICFDIAPSSNLVTGLVDDLKKHPARKMYAEGLKITVGTDDPIQCHTDLDSEYRKFISMGFTSEQILQTMQNSVDYSFDSG